MSNLRSVDLSAETPANRFWREWQIDVIRRFQQHYNTSYCRRAGQTMTLTVGPVAATPSGVLISGINLRSTGTTHEALAHGDLAEINFSTSAMCLTALACRLDRQLRDLFPQVESSRLFTDDANPEKV